VVTPAGQGFAKTDRLLRPAEFARVYELRQSAAAGPLVLYAAPRLTATAASRLGLSVSRRVGNAVVRNAWKRRLREAFRAVHGELPAGSDFVVVVRAPEPPVGAEGAARVARLLVDLARKVVGRRGYGRDGGGAATPNARRR
jgi:ribonuclease P protein component